MAVTGIMFMWQEVCIFEMNFVFLTGSLFIFYLFLKIDSCHRNFASVTWISYLFFKFCSSFCDRKFCLWQINLPGFGTSSRDSKFILMTRNFIMWQDLLPNTEFVLTMERIVFLWKEILCCNKSFLPATGNIILWKKM